MRVYFIPTAMVLATILTTATAKTGYGPGEQDWGHVDVRKGAHMFYWLYYTTANVKIYTDRPLVIWLQAGINASSSAYGNFEELGPLDLFGNNRSHNWVKDVNVLFIDSPVGSGFSYVDDRSNLSSNNTQIALDLVSFMKSFYERHPEFETVPLHIFGRSFAGKMVPEFALKLYYAIQLGELRSNLTSVVMGNPWVSPIDSVLSWAPLLLQMGFVDKDGYKKISASAKKVQQNIEVGNWLEALNEWFVTFNLVWTVTDNVEFSNIMKPTKEHAYDFGYDRAKVLGYLMHGVVAKALNISSGVVWGSQDEDKITILMADFMTPVTHIVEKLLNNTTLHVAVYSGQLDLVCPTLGTVNWIEKMQWSNKTDYEAAPRVAIYVDGILQGYEKSGGKFTMFWINRAGYRVPVDNPSAMSHVLRKITNFG